MNDHELCQRFANDHKLIFETEGECGFGRPCVGFMGRDGHWVAHNPFKAPAYEPIAAASCEAARPGEGVDNAYHKHDCMAILGLGDLAVRSLAAWVRQLEKAGNVVVVDFETGEQPSVLGWHPLGYAVMIREDDSGPLDPSEGT